MDNEEKDRGERGSNESDKRDRLKSKWSYTRDQMWAIGTLTNHT